MDKVLRFLRTAATVKGGILLYLALVGVGFVISPYGAALGAVGGYFLGRRGEANDHV